MSEQIVGNALVSAFIQDVLNRLVSPQVLAFFRRRKLDETLLTKLKVILLSIGAVADDAEAKHFIDRRVRDWLLQVSDVVLDADDLLNEIHCQHSNCEVEAESESQTSTCTVPNSFNVTSNSFHSEIERGMKEVLDHLEYLSSQKAALGLKEFAAYSGVGPGSIVSKKFSTASLASESVIYGRDDDKEIILKWLTSDTVNRSQLSILCIVGMGGIGKTTLAWHVYNDPRMEETMFDIKAWVSVSDDFDVFKVTRSILEAITKSKDDSGSLEMVHGRLKEKLEGKKFLLVLDDVWNEDRKLWKDVEIPLKYGVPGSTILVTTRSESVASIMSTTPVHRVKQLKEDDCWRLFADYAFQDNNPQLDAVLEEIGKEIADKCRGLPLALKVMGSHLRTKSSFCEWKRALVTMTLDGHEEISDIIQALLLSYLHLPSHLKRCFAYCALFPNDYEFVKQDLILFWMAENFLQSPINKSPEEVGEEYFNDLLSRSFFQQSIIDNTYFSMHDLMKDLAEYVCGDFCFRLEVHKRKMTARTTRHFSFVTNHNQYFDWFGSSYDHYDATWLRTFMPTGLGINFGGPWLCKMSIHELFSRFKFLHVLSLSRCCNLTEVPYSVGELKHLRSLDLSYTGIKQLPDSICFLYNLQILKLSYCNNLGGLPSNFHKLINLQFLELIGTKLSKVPDSVGDLIHLRSLDLSNTCIKKLPDSTCLLYNLQILKLSYCNNLKELPSNLHKLVNLRCLEFVATKVKMLPDSVGNLIHLHSLDLSKTCIKKLPDSTCLLYNLQILKLNFCFNMEELPSNLHKLVNLRCLEFVGTKLRKLPVQLGELKNLQVSCSFYVGNSSDFSIQQLGKLNLHRELSIGELQNIVNPSDAIAVDLKNKTQLEEVKLEWNRNWNQNQIPDDALKEKNVSENLQPSEQVRKLSIINYGGTQFPLWLFNNSLLNMVFLRLENCKYCQCLPPLGLLPSLKHLTITGLDGIVGIYAYFYGSSSSPFTSLETLEFSNMKEWKEWESDDLTCVFPGLQSLSLKQCPKLKGHLPKQIPRLKKMVIHDCKQLVASAPTAVAISDLDLQDCGELQFDYHPTALKGLIVRGHSMEASMLETIGHFICHTSLEFLLIDSCPSMNIPISRRYDLLEKLEISDGCFSLMIFPLDLFPKLCQLELRCPNLQMISMSLTHNHLKDLKISGCHQFESLPEHMHTFLPFLDSLHINDCPKVESFPEGGLPSNLTRMDLSNCYNLIASLKEAVGANTCLRTLSIGNLHVKSFPDEDFLPICLEVLQIRNCCWLEKLDYKGLSQLSSLEELTLDDCIRLQCLPEEGLPRSISTLRMSSYCSLLKQRCLEPEGEYWGKIAHIENIWIDGEPI